MLRNLEFGMKGRDEGGGWWNEEDLFEKTG
jgi:hypothetical protein